MNGMLIVVLVAIVALLDLFRLRAKNTTLSRAGFLVAALPRALMPVAAAAGLGAWILMKAYEGIAQTGSGGILVVAGGTNQAIVVLLAGVLAFLITVVVAFVMSLRMSTVEETAARRPVAAIIGVITIIAALGGGWLAMHWTDKIGVGMLAVLSRTSTLPAAPAGYSRYREMSGMEMARQSDRVITSQQLGGVLGGVAVLLCVLTPRLFSKVWVSDLAYTVVSISTLVLAVTAAAYSAHLWSGARWLQALMRE